jgi:IclR family acetate operon transcriptional repressor
MMPVENSIARALITDPSGDRARERSRRNFSRAVSKSLQALEILLVQHSPMDLNEMSQRLEPPKTSAFGILRTLESGGYLTLAGSGYYVSSFRACSGVSSQYPARLGRGARPGLHQLSRQLHETCSLAAVFDNRVEVIAVAESVEAIRMSNSVGMIVPPHASALGKVIAAYQPADFREKLLRSYGLHRLTAVTVVDRKRSGEGVCPNSGAGLLLWIGRQRFQEGFA